MPRLSGCFGCLGQDQELGKVHEDAESGADSVLRSALKSKSADDESAKHGIFAGMKRRAKAAAAVLSPFRRGQPRTRGKGLFATFRDRAPKLPVMRKIAPRLDALITKGQALGKKILASKLIPSFLRKKKSRRRSSRAHLEAKQRAHDVMLMHEMKDFTCAVNQAVRAGMMRAEYFMEKTIRERMEELRRLRLEEEDRRAWEEALRLARIKYSAQYAQEMWDYLHEWSLTEGVERVIAHRAYLEYLKSREGRVVTAFTRFARRLETRRRGAVLSRVALFRITLGRVFQSHDCRQDAARDIQCAFRILMARRTFLMAYIEREARMLDQEKADVWRKWAARLARAIQSIAHVETEAHRQARRRVWARTEFSRALAKEHFFTYGHPPSRDPPAVTSFQKPCDGRVALRLPDTKASKIVAPIGDDSPEARRLNWIGVPVGVALAKNEKGIGYRSRKGISTPDHFSLIYMPMPTHLLSVSFADARSRQKAQDDFENLKASALRPNQHIEEAPESATDWYEREQALLWGNTSALVDEV